VVEEAEARGRGAGFLLDEFEAVGDGAEGAVAFAGDFTGGKAVDAIEAEDGEGGRMFAALGASRWLRSWKRSWGALVDG